jgi:intracellular multiplication protein IcmV
MKKKSGSRIVRVFSRIVNIRLWFDWERTKSFTVALKNGIKFLFVPKKSAPSETFQHAVTTLKLNDEELLIKQTALLRLSILMLILAVLIFGYSGYHLFYGSFKAFLVSMAVTCIALALAFRYHFWYFQIKHRKLGCTVEEWYRQGILGEKK